MRRSGRSEAISSSTGPTTRQGPHHGAQKSTSTGPSDSMTSAWKLLSVTSLRLPAIAFPFSNAFLSLYKVKEGVAQDAVHLVRSAEDGGISQDEPRGSLDRRGARCVEGGWLLG